MDIFNYRQKMEGLQAKIRQSEMERRDLETKLHQMMRRQNERDKTKMRSLKDRYENFLEEEKRRLARNDKLLQTMEDIDYRASTLAAKTERLKLLKSQYELYLTRTWSPTAAAAPLHPYGPMTVMELNQAGISGLAQHPAVVYNCPSSGGGGGGAIGAAAAAVNANPQLNIQLPQYYRHSTIDSCSPAKYNELNPQQIILSRDGRHYQQLNPYGGDHHHNHPRDTMMASSFGIGPLAPSDFENNSRAGIFNVNRSQQRSASAPHDTERDSLLLAQQMDGLSFEHPATNATSNSHLLQIPASAQLYRDPSPASTSAQIDRTAVQTSALPKVIVSDSNIASTSAIPRAFESSVFSAAAAADPSSINQSARIRSEGYSKDEMHDRQKWQDNYNDIVTDDSRARVKQEQQEPWEREREDSKLVEDKDKNRNTGNQLETFTSSGVLAPSPSSSSPLLSATISPLLQQSPATFSMDYYSSKSPAGAGRAAAPAGDVRVDLQQQHRLSTGKSNDSVDDVNDIIPASYRFVSLSEQRNSQQMPDVDYATATGDGIASARINDNNQNAAAAAALQPRTNFHRVPRTELENYSERPPPGTTATDFVGGGDGGKTKTTSLNYRSTDHYFDDYVARDGADVPPPSASLQDGGGSSRDKDISVLASSQQRVHQKWEKIIEVDEQAPDEGAGTDAARVEEVDGRGQVNRRGVTGHASSLFAKSATDQFIDTLDSSSAALAPAAAAESQFGDYPDYGGSVGQEYEKGYYDQQQVDEANYYATGSTEENKNLHSSMMRREEEDEEGRDHQQQEVNYQQYSHTVGDEKADVGSEKSGYYTNNNNPAAAGELGQPHEYSELLLSQEQYINQNNYPVAEDSGTRVEDNMSSSYGQQQRQLQQQQQRNGTGSPNKSFVAHEAEGEEELKENYASHYYPTMTTTSRTEGGNSNEASPRKQRMTQLQEEEQQQQLQPLEMDQSYYTQEVAGGGGAEYHQESTPSALVHNNLDNYGEVVARAAAPPSGNNDAQQLHHGEYLTSPTRRAEGGDLISGSSSTYQSQSHYPNTGAMDDYGGNYEESGYVPNDAAAAVDQQQQPDLDYGNYLADATPSTGDDYQTNYPNDQSYNLDPNSALDYDDRHTGIGLYGDGSDGQQQQGQLGDVYQDYYNQGGEQQDGNYSIPGQEMGDGVNYASTDGNYSNVEQQQSGYYPEPSHEQQQQEDYYPDSIYQENQLQQQQQQPSDYYSEQQLDYNSTPLDQQQQPDVSSISYASDNTPLQMEVAPAPAPKATGPKKPIKKVQILESSDSDAMPQPHQKPKRTGPPQSVLKGGSKNKKSDTTGGGAAASDSSDFNFSSK